MRTIRTTERHRKMAPYDRTARQLAIRTAEREFNAIYAPPKEAWTFVDGMLDVLDNGLVRSKRLNVQVQRSHDRKATVQPIETHVFLGNSLDLIA